MCKIFIWFIYLRYTLCISVYIFVAHWKWNYINKCSNFQLFTSIYICPNFFSKNIYKSNLPHHYRIYPLKEIAYFRAPFPSPSTPSHHLPFLNPPIQPISYPFQPPQHTPIPPTFPPSLVSTFIHFILILYSVTFYTYPYISYSSNVDDIPTSPKPHEKAKIPSAHHGIRSADLTVQASRKSDALASRLRSPPSIRASRSPLMHISTLIHTGECISCSLFPVCRHQGRSSRTWLK